MNRFMFMSQFISIFINKDLQLLLYLNKEKHSIIMSLTFKYNAGDENFLQIQQMMQKYGKPEVDAYLSEGQEPEDQRQFVKRVLKETKQWDVLYFHRSKTQYVDFDSDSLRKNSMKINQLFVQNPKILIEISHIKFSSLFILNLEGNQISNIESLAFLNAQFLEYLSLRDNKITNLQPLSKSFLPYLKQLALASNPIRKQSDIKSLKRMSWQDSFFLCGIQWEVLLIDKWETKVDNVRLRNREQAREIMQEEQQKIIYRLLFRNKYCPSIWLTEQTSPFQQWNSHLLKTSQFKKWFDNYYYPRNWYYCRCCDPDYGFTVYDQYQQEERCQVQKKFKRKLTQKSSRVQLDKKRRHGHKKF